MHHREVALQVLFRVAPLLLADDHDRAAVQPPPAADHRRIVAEGAVAVQLDEVGEDALDHVERVRTLLVARDLHPLHGSERLEGLGPQLLQPGLQLLELSFHVEPPCAGQLFQVPDPGDHVADRALEILMRCHQSPPYRWSRACRNYPK